MPIPQSIPETARAPELKRGSKIVLAFAMDGGIQCIPRYANTVNRGGWRMDHSEVSRIAHADRNRRVCEAMNSFIAKLSMKRQVRVSIVCGAIVEQGEPTGGLNRQFWSDHAHTLAVAMSRKRAA